MADHEDEAQVDYDAPEEVELNPDVTNRSVEGAEDNQSAGNGSNTYFSKEERDAFKQTR